MIWCGGVSHHCLQKPKDFCCWDWKRLSGESPQTCGTPDTYRLCVKLPAQNIYPNCEPDWNGSGSNMVIRLESGPTGLDSTALLDKHTLQLIALSHASILFLPPEPNPQWLCTSNDSSCSATTGCSNSTTGRKAAVPRKEDDLMELFIPGSERFLCSYEKQQE